MHVTLDSIYVDGSSLITCQLHDEELCEDLGSAYNGIQS
jgi:hypothetical protein